MGPISPTPVRRTISVFGFGHGNFQTKLAADPLSPTLCRPKISGSDDLGSRVGSKSRRLAVTQDFSAGPKPSHISCCCSIITLVLLSSLLGLGGSQSRCTPAESGCSGGLHSIRRHCVSEKARCEVLCKERSKNGSGNHQHENHIE
jgi:hypothetical protein